MYCQVILLLKESCGQNKPQRFKRLHSIWLQRFETIISVGRDAALECYITKSQGYKVGTELLLNLFNSLSEHSNLITRWPGWGLRLRQSWPWMSTSSHATIESRCSVKVVLKKDFCNIYRYLILSQQSGGWTSVKWKEETLAGTCVRWDQNPPKLTLKTHSLNPPT